MQSNNINRNDMCALAFLLLAVPVDVNDDDTHDTYRHREESQSHA